MRSEDWSVVAPALALTFVLAMIAFLVRSGRVLSGDLARWDLSVDGTRHRVAVRGGALTGPAVMLDGQFIAAHENPPWNRYPYAPERRFSFTIDGHRAYIVEDRSALFREHASYVLMVDGQAVAQSY